MTTLRKISDKLISQVDSALRKVIPEGKALDLEDDTFLTGMLDGSDKIYGFRKIDGEILVVSRGGDSYGWGISSMDAEDADYICNTSAPNILKKIKAKEYEIVEEL